MDVNYTSEIKRALARCSEAAKDCGVSFDELTTTIYKAKILTGRSGDAIGNSLKAIFTRLGREEPSISVYQKEFILILIKA